jgi:hypothetical protein
MPFLIRRATTGTSNTNNKPTTQKRGRISIRKVDISRPIPLPSRMSFSFPETREVPLRESMMIKNLKGKVSAHKRNASEPLPALQPIHFDQPTPQVQPQRDWFPSILNERLKATHTSLGVDEFGRRQRVSSITLKTVPNLDKREYL